MKNKKFTTGSNNKFLLFCLLILIALMGAMNMNAQVTIGSGSPPHKGLLLELKENDNEGENSKRALGLPRVILGSPTTLTIDTNDDATKKKYVGAIVYNVNKTAPLQEGIYSWDGEKWIALTLPDAINISAENGIKAVNNKVTLGGEIIDTVAFTMTKKKPVIYQMGFSNLIIGRDTLKFSGRNDGVLRLDNATTGKPVLFGDIENHSIGIGTTTPKNKLEITHGSDGSSGLRLTNLKSTSLLGTNANGDVISTNAGNVAWALSGNSNIDVTKHFIGSTNAQDVAFRANNQERMRITSGGNVGIGTNNPAGKLDITSTTSGVLFPRLTTNQRDNIPAGYGQTGTIIYNKNLNKLQVNVGTDANRVWGNLDTSSATINTLSVFKSNGDQTINYTPNHTKIEFQQTIFSNASELFIKKKNNSLINLGAGRTYRIEVNMGRLYSSEHHHTWAYIRLVKAGGDQNLAAVSILPPNHPTLWNTMNTMTAYVTVPENAVGGYDVYISAIKQNAGWVIVGNGIPPTCTITIMD